MIEVGGLLIMMPVTAAILWRIQELIENHVARKHRED